MIPLEVQNFWNTIVFQSHCLFTNNINRFIDKISIGLPKEYQKGDHISLLTTWHYSSFDFQNIVTNWKSTNERRDIVKLIIHMTHCVPWNYSSLLLMSKNVVGRADFSLICVTVSHTMYFFFDSTAHLLFVSLIVLCLAGQLVEN